MLYTNEMNKKKKVDKLTLLCVYGVFFSSVLFICYILIFYYMINKKHKKNFNNFLIILFFAY